MNMIFFVLHNPELLEEVLDAWNSAGVSGVTILHSTGLGRVQHHALREDLPIFPSLEVLLQGEDMEDFSRTLFSVVEDAEVVEKVVAATQKVVGDLSQPRTGLLVVLPVSQVYGLDKNYHSK